jgi:hypothetical protein
MRPGNKMGSPHECNCACDLCKAHREYRDEVFRQIGAAQQPGITARHQHRHQEPQRALGIRRVVERDPKQEWVQKSFRIPRWVSDAILQCAEIHHQSESAVIRAWLMDAATEWLKTQPK